MTTENYNLSIDKNGSALINANGYLGIIRGLATLV